MRRGGWGTRRAPRADVAGVALALVATAIVLTGGARTASAQDADDPGPQLLINASIVDGSGRDAFVGWVRVEEGRIAAVGEGDPPDAGDADVIDLRGRSLIPGLADMHVHLGELPQAKWILKLLLAHGVTTIKEAGNRLVNLAQIRAWVKDERAAPHIAMSGLTLNGDRLGMQFLPAGSETGAVLDDNLSFGVDFLKIHNWVSSPALTQIATFAEANDVYLTGHVPLGMSSVAAIDRGLRILEHLRLRPAEVIDDPEVVARYPLDLIVSRRTLFWASLTPDSVAMRRTLDAWAARTFFLDPTLSLVEAGGLGEAVPGLDLMSPGTLETWRKSLNRYGDQEEDVAAAGEKRLEGMVRFVGEAHKRGIKILTGTDTPVLWVVPGVSLLRELELFVEAGMTPVEAIHASTGRAAEAFRSTDRGRIDSGQAADLVILRGDVARDITAIREIEQVMLGGTLHARDDLLEEAARLAAEHESRPTDGVF